MGEDHQILEVDILFVGGGPANLAGALRLTQLIANYNDQVSAGNTSSPRLEPRIALIEKGRDVGAFLAPFSTRSRWKNCCRIIAIAAFLSHSK